MADDAMDWNPTTPPIAHDPYSHSQYMPGGWPKSPPPFRYTSGVFARKRQPGIIERAAKRICTGVKTIGIIATLPVKPIYLVVRHLRNRQHRASREIARDQARLRRYPPALRARVEAAEQSMIAQGRKNEVQQILTPPSTPPQTHKKQLCRLHAPEELVHIQSPVATTVTNAKAIPSSPAASGVTDTETIAATPPPPPSRFRVFGKFFSHTRAGVKRRRDEGVETTHNIGVAQPVAHAVQAQQPTPEPELPLDAKRMKGPNRFDAGYKRSPTAYGSRGLTPGARLKAIGTRSKNSTKRSDVWGGWIHERPIEARNKSESTEQQGPASESQASDVDHESSSSTQVAQTHEATNLQANDETATRAGSESKIAYDERWSSVPLVEAFVPDELYEKLDSLRSKTTSAEPQSDAGKTHPEPSSMLTRLFYGKKAVDTPPIVKPRSTLSNHFLRSTKPDALESGTASAAADNTDPTTKNDHINTPDGRVPSREPSESEVPDLKHNNDLSLPETDLLTTETAVSDDSVDLVKPESEKALSNGEPATVPVTPMKVIAEKLASEELDKQTVPTAKNSFATPAEKLSKLSLEDRGDNDTPKATPHSGTKTTRVTRYREALEKAQRAKLEQYEIVPISNDWDKKVRAAVRNGIPDFLGPHDLARVVPQYASRGQDNWLNDETINKYLELVAEHGRKNDRPDQVRSHHTFNNFFYNNLRSKGPESVARWSKRAKIGGTNLAYVEKIFVPINSGAHWTLAVVEPSQKRITHYNSMRGTATGTRACEDLKDWVAFEQGKNFKEEEWTLTAVGESPQQTNSDDCGVFTITSARQVMLGYTPMSYGPAQIPVQRIRIVAELINRGLLRSAADG